MLRLLFLTIDWYFLVAAVTEKIFDSTAKPVIPIRTPAKEAKAEIETHPVTTEAEIESCKLFCASDSSVH